MRGETRVLSSALRGRVVAGVVVWLGLGPFPWTPALQAQALQPCCEGAGGSFCVLPWSTGQQDCEDQGGTLFQANACTASNECAVVHSAPARGVVELEIEVLDEGAQEPETVPVTVDDTDTLVVRMAPECFSPPLVGSECPIDIEIVELQLVGDSPLGPVIVTPSPTEPPRGVIGPVQVDPDGSFSGAMGPIAGNLLLVTGSSGGAGTLVTRRWLAQLTVNVVDFIEGDRLTGEFHLVEPVVLTPEPQQQQQAGPLPALGTGNPLAARQAAVGGQMTAMLVTFPELSVLEIPVLSGWGLALLALALAAAAWVVLVRR